uniref:Thiamine pyrophosphokinase n=1 Tax=Kalanchoe fedtschenkoi TaxID=63787 RepID=A0A7N0TB99_KALFE
MALQRHTSTFLLPPIPASSVANGPADEAGTKYALVVLNQSVPRFTPLLWEHAKVRLCADGGANRLFDEMPLLFPDEDPAKVRNRYLPHVIKGDMDSIRKEVLDYYLMQGTQVVDESHDQDTTDLHKCINYICTTTPEEDKSNLCILVLGALGGRFDHEFGNINVLYRFPNLKIVLLSDDSLIYLLPKRYHHEIHIMPSIEGPHCGLIPVGMPAGSTTTTGLKWNLTDTEMRFGGLVSTSNLVNAEKLTVKSDTDLLWTISIKKP